ncbi:hypothetical protein [Streptomyces tauricus]|uniref:hypothetical protein n=1 Tax=Streptomyces tauricus TaxID=68274 RepID=UPI0022440B57|nr:hypothetical protein [Streptomyces tauricus]MCW8101736.1 hypothetical protein [Streptomyces tauricus]
MTNHRVQSNEPVRAELPHYQEILDNTDWASLETPSGTGELLPTALVRLLHADPRVRATAVVDALRVVTHQNTIYEATVPVALYVATVLNHPATVAGGFEQDADQPPHYLTRVALLDWLSSTAYDADDECVAIGERSSGSAFLDECPDMRAFRGLRPSFYSAVHPLLEHDDADVRAAALVAALPLAEHPALAQHRSELVDHARRLLNTSTDRYKRDRVLEALTAWGHDISGLENADDVAVRELRARRIAERWTGGCSEDPPF